MVRARLPACATKLAAGSTTPDVPTAMKIVHSSSEWKMRSNSNGTSPNQQMCGAVLVETRENQSERTLVRDIEVFSRIDDLYRRSHEVHTVRLFEVTKLCEQLASLGFATETARSYGAYELPPRRHAFFARRLAEDESAEHREAKRNRIRTS